MNLACFAPHDAMMHSVFEYCLMVVIVLCHYSFKIIPNNRRFAVVLCPLLFLSILHRLFVTVLNIPRPSSTSLVWINETVLFSLSLACAEWTEDVEVWSLCFFYLPVASVDE